MNDQTTDVRCRSHSFSDDVPIYVMESREAPCEVHDVNDDDDVSVFGPCMDGTSGEVDLPEVVHVCTVPLLDLTERVVNDDTHVIDLSDVQYSDAEPGVQDDDLEIVGQDMQVPSAYFDRPVQRLAPTHPSIANCEVYENFFFEEINSPRGTPSMSVPRVCNKSTSTISRLTAYDTDQKERSVAMPHEVQTDNPTTTVEALLGKLICPICYRNFRRKKIMTDYTKWLRASHSKDVGYRMLALLDARHEIDSALEELQKSLLMENTSDVKKAKGDGVVSSRVSLTSTPQHDTTEEEEEDRAVRARKKRSLPSQLQGLGSYDKQLQWTMTTEAFKAASARDSDTDDNETSELRVGRCGHVYCAPCIKKHTAQRKRCPVCNQSLSGREMYPLYL